MVHALKEVRRVLAAGGVLVDLRPLADSWPVEVVSRQGHLEVGRIADRSEGLADDAAANEAMKDGERAGLFRRQEQDTFPFYYTWDSPSEMKQYIEEEWVDFAELDEQVWQHLRSAWAIAEADARVGVRATMLITRWIKTE